MSAWEGHAVTHPNGDHLAYRILISGGQRGVGFRRWLVMEPHDTKGTLQTRLESWVVRERPQYTWTAPTITGKRSKFPRHAVVLEEMEESRQTHYGDDALSLLLIRGLAHNELSGDTRNHALGLIWSKIFFEDRAQFLKLCSFADDDFVRSKVCDLMRRYGDWTIYVETAGLDQRTRAELDALTTIFNSNARDREDVTMTVPSLLAAALRQRVITDVDFRDALSALRLSSADQLTVRNEVIHFVRAHATPLQHAIGHVRAYAHDVIWRRDRSATDTVPDRAGLHALKLIWALEADPTLVAALLDLNGGLDTPLHDVVMRDFIQAHVEAPEVVHDDDCEEEDDAGFIQPRARRRRAQ